MERWLVQHGVAYTYRDITLDPAAWQAFLELGDRIVTPTTVIDGKVVVGYRPERFRELLGL